MVSPARTRLPHDKIRDRAVVDGVAQLLRGQTPFQAQGDLGLGRGAQDVPGFGLAVRQPDGLRVRVVRMNLDGKRLIGEQQLQQKRRSDGRRTGALVPDFADRIAVPACAAPRTRIYDTPRFWQGMRDRMFNRHGPCFHFDRKGIFAMPFKAAPIEPGARCSWRPDRKQNQFLRIETWPPMAPGLPI